MKSRYTSLRQMLGLSIVAIRGSKQRKNAKYIETEYIMFSDGETLIHLEDQDYYSYHDCSSSAKEIVCYSDKVLYDNIMNDNDNYGNSNVEL